MEPAEPHGAIRITLGKSYLPTNQPGMQKDHLHGLADQPCDVSGSVFVVAKYTFVGSEMEEQHIRYFNIRRKIKLDHPAVEFTNPIPEEAGVFAAPLADWTLTHFRCSTL